MPPDLLIFGATVKLKRNGVRASVSIFQLKPRIGYHGNVAHLSAGKAWQLDTKRVLFQLPLRQHPGARNGIVCIAEHVGRNHNVNCSEPMNHERTILSRPFLFGRAKIRLNRKAKSLQICAASLAKDKNMGRLTVSRHWQRAKT
jgi:hypothetical protein